MILLVLYKDYTLQQYKDSVISSQEELEVRLGRKECLLFKIFILMFLYFSNLIHLTKIHYYGLSCLVYLIEIAMHYTLLRELRFTSNI